MPYETLIDALLEEGRAKSEAILRKAQAEAERLLCENPAAVARHLARWLGSREELLKA